VSRRAAVGPRRGRQAPGIAGRYGVAGVVATGPDSAASMRHADRATASASPLRCWGAAECSRTHATSRGAPRRDSAFANAYPSIATWVVGYGWIELGDDLPGLPHRSFIRALNEGGLIWAGEATYPTIETALRTLDPALGTWMRQELGE
jgi:hypothetical protein